METELTHPQVASLLKSEAITKEFGSYSSMFKKLSLNNNGVVARINRVIKGGEDIFKTEQDRDKAEDLLSEMKKNGLEGTDEYKKIDRALQQDDYLAAIYNEAIKVYGNNQNNEPAKKEEPKVEPKKEAPPQVKTEEQVNINSAMLPNTNIDRETELPNEAIKNTIKAMLRDGYFDDKIDKEAALKDFDSKVSSILNSEATSYRLMEKWNNYDRNNRRDYKELAPAQEAIIEGMKALYPSINSDYKPNSNVKMSKADKQRGNILSALEDRVEINMDINDMSEKEAREFVYEGGDAYYGIKEAFGSDSSETDMYMDVIKKYISKGKLNEKGKALLNNLNEAVRAKKYDDEEKKAIELRAKYLNK